MKRILTLLAVLLLGVTAYSQSVKEYTSVLKAKGYSLCTPQQDESTISYKKIDSPASYVVVIKKAGEKIQEVTVVAVISQKGQYNFDSLEPVAIYPQYFESVQEVNGLFLAVAPYVPTVEILGNQVQLAAIYKPLIPVPKQ